MSNNMNLNLEYVSNVIRNEYKEWKKGDVIKIVSQTGTGKSYFIKDVLIPYVDRLNRNSIETKPYNILILTNRIALSRQVKLDVLKKLNKKVPNCCKGLDSIRTIDNVNIMNYQSLLELLLNDEFGFSLENYDFVICDEVHYLYSDSFTGRTTIVSDELFKENNNSIRIFMSATITDELEDKINNISCNKVFEYDTNRDYSYLKPHLFFKDEQVVNRIINDKSKDKWLYFVDSKKKGESIRQKLQEYGIDCAFVYRNCKKQDKKELDNIVANEKFDCKVLISTSILDNGINIKDSNVKHIITTVWDETNLIQSIGRIRFESFKNAYNINLYIKVNNGNEINGKLRRVQNNLDVFNLLIEDENKFLKKYGFKLETLPRGINMGSDRKFTYDEISYSYLKIQEKRLSKYKDNPEKFCKSQLRRLHLIPYILDDVEIEVDKDETEKYIKNLIDQPLGKQQQQELIQMINLRDARGRQQKSFKIVNSYLQENYNMHLENKRMYIGSDRVRVWIINNK